MKGEEAAVGTLEGISGQPRLQENISLEGEPGLPALPSGRSQPGRERRKR